MAKETVEIVIPSSPADRKALFNGVRELSNSYTRIEGEKDHQKALIESLSEKIGLDKKYIKRMAVEYHKDLFEQKAEEQDAFSALYETIINGGKVEMSDDDEGDDFGDIDENFDDYT
jgi:hypothetical protein